MQKINLQVPDMTTEVKHKADGASDSTLSLRSFWSDLNRIRLVHEEHLRSTLMVISRQYLECDGRGFPDASLVWHPNVCLILPGKEVKRDCSGAPIWAVDDNQPIQSPISLTSKQFKFLKFGKKHKLQRIEAYLSEVKEEIIQETLDRYFSIYQGIVECLFINCKFIPQHSHEETLRFFLKLVLEDRLEDYYKYFSVLLFCLHTEQQELPPRPACLSDLPKTMYLALGATGRFIRKMAKGILTKNSLSTLFSLTSVKACGLPLNRVRQSRFLEKHRKNMKGESYDPPSLFEFRMEFRNTFRYIREKDVVNHFDEKDDLLTSMLLRICNIVYNGKTFSRKWKSPSLGSTIEGSRKDCGALGAITKNWETPSFKYFECMPNLGPKAPICTVYRDGTPEELFSELYDRLRKQYPPENHVLMGKKTFNHKPAAKVHMVLEPFKVRPITSGETDLYQFNRILQSTVWGKLKKHNVFKLTGLRATQSSLSTLQGSYYGFEDEFVAGDYDAASDGINPLFSSRCQEAIAMYLGLTPEETYWYLQSMTGHELDYSNYMDWDYLIEQTWGQLMGSPSSFPVLCLINCAGFSAAVKIYELSEPYEANHRKASFLKKVVDADNEVFCEKRFNKLRKLLLEYDDDFVDYSQIFNDDNLQSLYDEVLYLVNEKYWLDYLHFAYGLMINGDDILFHGPPNLINLWYLYEREVGLKPSVGKNFRSETRPVSGLLEKQRIGWSMINNTMFLFYVYGDEIFKVELLPYIKMGLAQGKSKVQSDSRDDRENPDEDLLATLDKLEESGYGLPITLVEQYQVMEVSSVLLTKEEVLENENKKEGKLTEKLITKTDLLRDVFIHHALPKLKKSKRSWTLPRPLGGLGLNFLKSEPTPTCLRVAEFLYRNPGETLTVSKVAPYYPSAFRIPRVNFTLTEEDKIDTWSNFGAGYWFSSTCESSKSNMEDLMEKVSPEKGRYPKEIKRINIRNYKRKRTLYLNL